MIVDAVYTWVNGCDPAWQRVRQNTRKELNLPDDSQESGFADRYIQNGEIQLSLQSLKRFAPWIRRIYIVTMNQIPPYLPPDLDIQIVDHTEILSADALPTFNSFAIETALHKIPDLAEHFIYFNDDMFLGSPVRIADFFNEKGQCIMPWVDNNVVQHSRRNTNSYESALYTSSLHVAKQFGIKEAAHICRYPSHTVVPKTKFSMIEAWRIFPTEMKQTERSRFRQFEQTIHFITNYIDLASGRAILQAGDARYFATDIALKEHWLSHRSVPKLFCVNQVRSNEFQEIMKAIFDQQAAVKIRRRRF